MSWEERIISDQELEPYLRREGPLNLPIRVEALIEHQKAHWPLLARGCESLSQVAIKEIALGEFSLIAQHNPGRITSTAAQVDRQSIEERPCFLCPENLAPEEKGLRHGENLVLLCNPYPIMARHLSIVHRSHIPQAIAGNLETMLDLAHDLGNDSFVLYNGPGCGASAPDHLHFQAAARDHLPIEAHLRSIEQNLTDHSTGGTEPDARCKMRDTEHASRIPHRASRIRQLLRSDNTEVFTLEGYHVGVLIYRGRNRQRLVELAEKTLDLLAQLTRAEPEPMINLIVTADGDKDMHSQASESAQFNSVPLVEQDSCYWTVFLFPRSKHRPRCYYTDTESHLTISPAAIDLAGLVVVPIREHFERVSPNDLRQIFSEVTLARDVFDKLIKRLR